MDSQAFTTVLGAVLPVVTIALAGVALRKANWLTEDADASLLKVTINLLSPCLILDSILGNKALQQPGNVLLAPLIGYATVAAGIAFAMLFRRAAGAKDPLEGRTFAFTVGVYNYGYIAIPLGMLLFDRETVGVLFVHNVGTEFAFWTIGLVMLGGANAGAGWHKLLSPPVLAIPVALGINFAGGKALLPEFVVTTAHLLAQCAIPLGVILVGAMIADEFHEFHAAGSLRMIAVASVLRLGVLPLAFLLLAKWLPCSVELKRVMMLQAAMPSAVFPIILAKHYGGDVAAAVRISLGSTLVAVVTIPLWLRIGARILGIEL
jgi:predicted permease